MTERKIQDLGKLPQPTLDFERIVHERENTQANEKHLNSNRYHFTGQAVTVLAWLQKGLFVTSMFASSNGISDLQRRIGDLGEFGGIDIDREYVIKDNGKPSRFLAYFLPENRCKFIEEKRIVDKRRWWYSELYTNPEIINAIKNQTP